jgi:hypothetical protein
MKQNFTKKGARVFVAFSVSLLLLNSCAKKGTDPVVENLTPKTGNFSIQLGNNNLQGNIYGDGVYTQGHEFTGQPTLELHLAGNNGQIDVLLLNPTVNTDIKCGINNSDNLFKVADYTSGTPKSYASGDQGNVTVRLTKLDEKSAVGTVSGLLKNIDYPASADANISSGNFTINF